MNTRPRVYHLIYLSVLVFLIAGCSLKPTKVFQTESYDSSELTNSLKKPIPVDDSTVILDARSPFEFAMAHLPGSKNVSWSDFAQKKGPYPGLVKKNLRAEIRRLALMGIDKNSNIVVVGRGNKGDGGAGRLAWTMLFLGIKNVHLSDIDALGLRYSNLMKPPPKENKRIWAPVVKNQLAASRSEVIASATAKDIGRTHVIDVRSREEYFYKTRNRTYKVPDLRATHINWREFFTESGRPSLKLRKRLQKINILPKHRVILISNNGVRSGAAAYALLALGYTSAANYAGGYSELLKKRAD